jgi:hypothetical protein
MHIWAEDLGPLGFFATEWQKMVVTCYAGHLSWLESAAGITCHLLSFVWPVLHWSTG